MKAYNRQQRQYRVPSVADAEEEVSQRQEDLYGEDEYDFIYDDDLSGDYYGGGYENDEEDYFDFDCFDE